MPIWKTPIDLESLSERSENTLVSHCQITFTEVGDDYLIAEMPILDQVKQPLGIMHGGASCVLAESVGSVAANYAVNIQTHFCVGLSIYTNHIRSIRDGRVAGRASPRHLGKSTQVWLIEITNEQQQLISSTQLTMAVLERRT